MVNEIFVLTRLAVAALSLLISIFTLLLLENFRKNPRAFASEIYLSGKKSFVLFALAGLSYSTITFIAVLLKIDSLRYFGSPIFSAFMLLGIIRLYRITKF